MVYKIVYADRVAAMDRGGLVFNNQLEADEYVKKANQESPGFHHWFEPIPEPGEKITALEREMLKRQAAVLEQ